MKLAKFILHKLNQISVYFYYTAKPHRINPIYYLRLINEGNATINLRRNYEELFQEICGLIARSGSTGGEFADYLELYQTVKRTKPNYILECGSGITSLVIAYALQENFRETGRKGKLISMEENEYYHTQIRDLFPQEYIAFVDFKLSERKERFFGNLLGSYYEEIPKYPYELMYIDGPTERKSSGSKKCFNADLLNLVESSGQLTKFTALLDQRITTLWAFQKLLPSANISYSPVKQLTRITLSKQTDPPVGV